MNAYATKILVLIWVIGLLGSSPLHAQVAGASLTGTITDAQGGVVVGAKVSAKNVATGVTNETQSNVSGIYTLVNINAGNYEVSFSAPGFTTAVSKIQLTVGAQQLMNISLTVGQVSQTVEVTGAAPIVQTENATLSGNIESAQIVELPLNGRDWAQLATLEPGVVQVRVHEQVTQPGGNLRGLGNQMTIDGNRPTQNVYRLNGIIVNDYSNAGPGNVLGANLGVDAIQEFSVLTANYSAEYGFTSGGVINAITKSGTNGFHGNAYEFIRNKAFDSSDYLDAGNKPPFVRNQFGGSGGGPIMKNKLFVFADYEGIRQRQGVPVTDKVLSPNARLGILNDPKGNPLPALVGPCLKEDGLTLNPDATNLAPGQASTCVDNFVHKYYEALAPKFNNGLIGPDFNTGNFLASADQAVDDDYGTARVDWTINDKDKIDAAMYRDYSTWAKPGTFAFDTTGYTLPNMSVAIEENHIFSPALVNSARIGWTQSIVTNPGLSVSNPAMLDKSLGITMALNAPGVGGQAGGGTVGGVTGPGGFSPQGGFSDWVQNYQFFDDLSRSVGKHTLKFGFQFLRNHTDLVNGNGNGSVGFFDLTGFLQNEPITVRMPTIPPWTAGNTKHYNRNSVFGGYVQDDWKFKGNLTINVGLRYEMSTIPDEKNGKYVLLPTLWADPTGCVETITGLPSGCGALRNKVFASNPTLRNFEPRVGFAWDPFKNGKTSVRGGFGMFDVLPMPFMFGLNALQASPAGAELDLTNAGQGSCVTQTLPACPLPQGSFAQGLVAAAATAAPGGALASNSGRWQYTDANPKRNYVMQYNFNIQRQITPNTSLTVAYAGSRALHNPFQTDTLNTCFPTKTSAGWLFPNQSTEPGGICPAVTSPAPTGIVAGTMVNPFISGLELSTAFFGQAWYNSLQVNFAKKISHGFQYEVSFTWQKSFDTSSGSFAGDNFSSAATAATPWWDLSIVRGLSDFNITRNLSVNWLYQIPTPKSFTGPAGLLAKGWGVEGLLDLSDGAPIWPLAGFNSDPLGQNNTEPMDIPDLAPGCTPKNAVQPGNIQYLKPSCFIYPKAPNMQFALANCNQTPAFGPNNAQGTLASFGLDPLTCTNLLGHLPRNAIIGPGLFNVDMSIVKDTHIAKFGETFNIQFRAEFFNILNHTNFAPPSDNLVTFDPNYGDQPSFGQLDQNPQVPMRQIQFGLKVSF
ncbi:MAG TPA: carboxypeptidase regulatory-like domain-containing protein [Verrucomicrobiae bacterium]|nr:carboxypeptidase regulatory-like domain-containing protein [Verrucomicrobiae bacterium]